jgi:hypothetical protein
VSSAAPPLIVPTAYAAGANVTNLSADRLDGLDSSDFAQTVHNHVGQQWTATSGAFGLSVTSTSPTVGGALRGIHSGAGSPSPALEGINNQALAGASAIFGYTTNTVAVNYGVVGRSQSSQGIGVRGEATTGIGNTWGVYGYSASTAGRGVVGQAIATSGVTYGVYGEVASSTGYGLFTPDNAHVGADLTVGVDALITRDLLIGDDLVVTGDSNIAGVVGIGTTAPSAQLDVERSGLPVAEFNRTTNDGVVISIAQDGAVQGSISVAGATVSYNAFTGSHYAWTDAAIERGMLVSLTGENRRLYGRDEAEPIYGVALAQRANDTSVLGSYLGRLEPSRAEEPVTDNPHLVTAVGNGELWVVESGGDIEPGDELVASATPGHAMRDDGRFEVSHVVARAAERVRWRDVVDRRDGARRRLISVLFESHARESTSALRAALDRSTGELAELRRLVAAQSSRLEVLEAALRTGQEAERRVARSSVTGER